WEHILAKNSHAGSQSVPTLIQIFESQHRHLVGFFEAFRQDSRQYGFTGTRPTIDTNNEWASRAVASHASMLEHRDRKSTRLNSSHVSISYAVFCLKKKN